MDGLSALKENWYLRTWAAVNYTPEKLEWVSWQGTEATKLRDGESIACSANWTKRTEENTKLRQMFVDQGVVDELYTMKDTTFDLG